jgi:hypothetical protein
LAPDIFTTEKITKFLTQIIDFLSNAFKLILDCQQGFMEAVFMEALPITLPFQLARCLPLGTKSSTILII